MKNLYYRQSTLLVVVVVVAAVAVAVAVSLRLFFVCFREDAHRWFSYFRRAIRASPTSRSIVN